MKMAFKINLLIGLALLLSVQHAQAASLKSEIRINRDVITLADLVEEQHYENANTPLFRAPALGETGTIQVVRIQEALQKIGVTNVNSSGMTQISVVRDARRVSTSEIEQTIIQSLASKINIDANHMSVIFDGTPPTIIASPDVSSGVKVDDVSYDPRARRVSAAISVATQSGAQRRTLRVTGQLVEMMPVAVLNRSINRGEMVQSSDVSIEKRPRESAPNDAIVDLNQIMGFIARRTIMAGSPIKQGDLIRPDVVARGDTVTIIFEGRGLMITARGKALEAGGVGAVIGVQNLQSKRTIQATIAGAGKVIVSPVSFPALNNSAANNSATPSSKTQSQLANAASTAFLPASQPSLVQR